MIHYNLAELSQLQNMLYLNNNEVYDFAKTICDNYQRRGKCEPNIFCCCVSISHEACQKYCEKERQ